MTTPATVEEDIQGKIVTDVVNTRSVISVMAAVLETLCSILTEISKSERISSCTVVSLTSLVSTD